MYDIYYAHHQWKYGTKIEEYEIDFIRKCFPMANIFNPATDLQCVKCGLPDESEIMDECLRTVENSDIFVFSSMDGVIGKGVYREVKKAKETGKIIFYIFNNILIHGSYVEIKKNKADNDRLFAMVAVRGGNN